MKKLIALALAVVMVLSLGACSVQKAETPAPTAAPAPAATEAAAPAAPEAAAAPVEISLWTYPIGDWGNEEAVNALLADFNAAYPNIKVTVEYLAYGGDGDNKVASAIESHTTPDIVMEGPERLVANWGARGVMLDLADLWTEEAKADIYPAVQAACVTDSGAYYEYPLCTTAHTMAINKTVFEETGAMQYIDQETRTWSTENFFKAVQTLYDAGYENVLAIFCNGSGGDQGTRALINNLYNGTFANEEHTAYTFASEENIKALEALIAQPGIHIDAGINGGGEADTFAKGQLLIATCWNAGNESARREAMEANGVIPYPVNFPTNDGEVKLCNGIWGFGIFDNGDAARAEAAKTFVKWACDENTDACVKASKFFSVRASHADTSSDYSMFLPNMADYYAVTPGWTDVRTAYAEMLQAIGTGTPVAEAVAAFDTAAQAAAAG